MGCYDPVLRVEDRGMTKKAKNSNFKGAIGVPPTKGNFPIEARGCMNGDIRRKRIETHAAA